jgi:hypothetical protein
MTSEAGIARSYAGLRCAERFGRSCPLGSIPTTSDLRTQPGHEFCYTGTSFCQTSCHLSSSIGPLLCSESEYPVMSMGNVGLFFSTDQKFAVVELTQDR